MTSDLFLQLFVALQWTSAETGSPKIADKEINDRFVLPKGSLISTGVADGSSVKTWSQ